MSRCCEHCYAATCDGRCSPAKISALHTNLARLTKDNDLLRGTVDRLSAWLARTRAENNKADGVPCKTCCGTGRVPLVPSLAETLRALSDGPHSAGELSVLLGTSATAMNNRLEELRAIGLVRRSRAVPRGYRYERASGVQR